MGTNIDFNAESFVFLNCSRFKTTEWCEARITAVALPDRRFNSSSSLSLFVNATPSYLNFFTYFNDTPPTCREHWTRFLERCRTSVLEVLIFISANVTFRCKAIYCVLEASKSKSSAKSNRSIVHLPIVT